MKYKRFRKTVWMLRCPDGFVPWAEPRHQRNVLIAHAVRQYTYADRGGWPAMRRAGYRAIRVAMREEA